MIIRMKENARLSDIGEAVRVLESGGGQGVIVRHGGRAQIGVQRPGSVERTRLAALPGVEEVVEMKSPYRLVSRAFHDADTIVRVGRHKVGGGRFCVMAGPCSVENEEQIFRAAAYCRAAGATVLRAGAYKPRTSPYSFQGLGEAGIRLLSAAGAREGLATVTEVLSVEHLDFVAAHIDVLQIGARNMQNFKLLEAVGRTRKPVLLKRGMNATIEEFLLAAEYISSAGSGEIMLCERGIRTFENYTRNTLDIAAVPALKTLSHLPVIVDPSYASGRREMVLPLGRAALAAGADGLMIETHPDPDRALSDGDQSLPPDQFESAMRGLVAFHQMLGSGREMT